MEQEVPTHGVSVVERDNGKLQCKRLVGRDRIGKDADFLELEIPTDSLSVVESCRMSVSIVETEKGMQRCLVLGTGKSNRWFVGDEKLWDERLNSQDRERHAKVPSSWNWKIRQMVCR